MVYTYENLVNYLQMYGVVDFLLPFLLVFVIVFAVLQKTELLGKDKKNFNVVVSLILGLIFVVPHMTGSYPLGYDPVQILNEVLPSISLVAVAAIMLLILLGVFGGDFTKSAMPVIGIISVLFVLYIFGSALGWWTAPHDWFYWWTEGTTELIVIILVFAVMVWLIVKEPAGKTAGGDFLKGIKDWFKKD